jgi:hypothetical protein
MQFHQVQATLHSIRTHTYPNNIYNQCYCFLSFKGNCLAEGKIQNEGGIALREIVTAIVLVKIPNNYISPCFPD